MINMPIDEFYSRKRQVILDNDGNDRKLSAIIEPNRINGEFIKLGGFYSDDVIGWYAKEDVYKSVLHIVKTFDEDTKA